MSRHQRYLYIVLLGWAIIGQTTARALIVPQYFQSKASDALVLRLLGLEVISPDGPAGEASKSISLLRCRVEGVLWSDSGLLTNDTILLVVPTDPRAISEAKAQNQSQDSPGPQKTYVEPPLLGDLESQPLFRAFVSSVNLEQAIHEVQDWGEWAVIAIAQANPRNGFFLPGAKQYSFLNYFSIGTEFPGLLETLIVTQDSDHPADTAILLNDITAQAFASSMDSSQTVELKAGTVLEWLGPVNGDKGADHWAYEPEGAILYSLPCNSYISNRPTWVVHHCDLKDQTVRETALALAIAEKGLGPVSRNFSAERRLLNYHTRLEEIGNPKKAR